MLHNNPRPGYAGPGLVSLDGEGILTLAREVPEAVLCLKIFYVYEVNPQWNIPLRIVADLKLWLNRQFLASQDITPMPKLNTRAITTLDSIWELLAEFDASMQHQSAFVRATPVDLASRMPIVEASVIPRVWPTQMGPTNAEVGMVAQEWLGTSTHNAYNEDQEKLVAAGLTNCHNAIPATADTLLQYKNQAQEAEIERLTSSINQYSGRVRSANGAIRSLRNELRDSRNHSNELQDKYNKAKLRADRLLGSRAGAEVSHLLITCKDAIIAVR